MFSRKRRNFVFPIRVNSKLTGHKGIQTFWHQKVLRGERVKRYSYPLRCMCLILCKNNDIFSEIVIVMLSKIGNLTNINDGFCQHTLTPSFKKYCCFVVRLSIFISTTMIFYNSWSRHFALLIVLSWGSYLMPASPVFHWSGWYP